MATTPGFDVPPQKSLLVKRLYILIRIPTLARYSCLRHSSTVIKKTFLKRKFEQKQKF